jgi:acetylornithine deacetylase/succinyl-diaminopimelate desuccinylase-like protein
VTDTPPDGSRSSAHPAAGPPLSEGGGAEVVELLARLIRADTSNPPGDVRPALAVLMEFFAAHGVDATIAGEAPEVGNCVARLTGSGGGRSLLLLGHLDVVPADAQGWEEPPFSGRVRDGYVWGRGAVDMKHQLAAQAVAFVRLARRAAAGSPPRGDLVFAATADEETGVRCGARWLLEHHPDLLRVDFTVNEGGWSMPHAPAGPLYVLHTGEKGYANTKIRIVGRAAHGSMPQHRGNAVNGLAAVLAALDRYEPEVVEASVPEELIDLTVEDDALRERLKDPATAQRAVRELAATSAGLAALIEPLLGLTIVATVVRTQGDAVNVIPPAAEVHIDCRILPEQTEEDVRRELGRALAGVDAEWELLTSDIVSGNRSTPAGPLRDAIAATLGEVVPGARVVGELGSWFTDSAHVRRFVPGAVAYGFCPFASEDFRDVIARLHGVDERIAVADLQLQAEFFERLAARVTA